METKLDPDQRKAVEHFKGPALVIAGPGSGKTRIIIERILTLIQENNIKSYQILALAFNKKAASELEQRLSLRLAEIVARSGYETPEICTLHAFGRRIIINNHRKLNLKKEPSTWRAFRLEITIREEVAKLNREKAHTKVTIYKVSSKKTGRCYYIGQTTNLQRRKKEHLADSSNSYLRQIILTEGIDSITFTPIDEIEGMFADKREAEWIEHYKDLTVFNSELENEAVEGEIVGDSVTIYKIESKATRRCYVGYTTDPSWVAQNFKHIHNDALQEAIEDEGEEQFTFEVLQKEVPVSEISQCIVDEIETHRNSVVFNQSNPLSQRYADRLLIEFFCEHFNICYAELLKRPSDIENFADKIKDFEKLASNIEKAKREVALDFSDIRSIDDIIDAIIRSIDDLVVRGFAEKYEQKKKEANAIDFQDMIIYSTYLLETHPDIRKNHCEKYQYVHVDEFQDISFADFRLIKLLPENLFAVGDDDQAIYGFRGGDSEIMQNFRKRNDVKKYQITRNYRSTSTIVGHSKILIEHNPNRISKNLHAKNPATYPLIKTLEIQTPETIENTFLREFSEPVCQIQFIDDRIPIFENTTLKIDIDIDPQTIGILARYRSEVEKLRKLLINGFKEIEGETQRKEGDPFSFFGRSSEEIIEGGTIHSAKGKEYDKVILIHNTPEDKDFPFHDSDDITEDRRVFYVAMTRAKHELVILGGECQFVAEAGLSAITHKRKKELEKKSKTLNTAIVRRIDIAKKTVDELSETMQAALVSILTKQIEVAIKETRKQYEYELSHLRKNAHEAEKIAKDTARQLETELPTDLKAANEALLEELIPVLDAFEAQINSLPASVETNDIPIALVSPTESVCLAHKQMLDSLKSHGLSPIETHGEIFNPTYHEKVLPDIYSDEVQAGWIAKEEQRGYLLHDRVIRKAQVVISKGENIREPERLDQVVDIYLDRLIFAFQAKYKLSNIDQCLVKQEMVEYLLKLDDELLKEIVSFASKNKAEAIQLKRYADYCVGQEKIHRCTGVFRDFWNKMWEVITTLNENIKQADTLLNQDFAQPVRFVTYAGFRDLRNVETFNNGVKGLDSQGEEVQLQSLNVLFAFPKDDMVSLKSHIKKRRDIANQNLQPIELISERFYIANDILKLLLIKPDVMESDNQNPTIELVTRSGHILRGHLQNFDENFLYMHIKQKIVIVYRAGILRFKNLIWNEITKAYKNNTSVNGHIIERSKGGLRVKFKLLIGFLPASQVEIKTVRNLGLYVGKTLKMKVTKLSKSNNTIVFSRRALLEEEQTKLFNTFREILEEPITLRNIKRMSKMVEPIPEVNESPLIPKAKRTPLDKSISMIVTEPTEELIDTLPPISTDFTESLDTDVKDCKPETRKTVEVRRDSLYESIDLTVPDPVKKVVDSRLPKPKGFSEIPNPQTQNLTSEILEIEIDPKPLDAVNNNSPLTPQEHEAILKKQIQEIKPDTLEPDIVSYPPIAINDRTQGYEDLLKKQIQEIKPDTSDPENSDNVTQEPTLETDVDRETPVELTTLKRSDSSTITDRDAYQTEGEDSSENKVEDAKKSFRYYLRRGGRFAVEKIKATIFKKLNS